MKLERLDINDFGLFSNQTIKDIGPEIVVIGGLNRAGKTTLLQILRYLGYGFPNIDSLPPARNRYRVGADLRLESGERYNINLDGYGEPKVNRLGEESPEKVSSPEKIYNNLDQFSYQQLFTISLDELQQVPNKDDKQKKLQSILLGAGLSDIIKIQNISKDLNDEAESIGGKNGSCGVYEFKAYNEEINQGLDLRQEALNQVKEYRTTQAEFKEKEEEITERTEELEYLRAEVTVLDILKNNFKNWAEKNKFELELEKYEEKNLNSNYYNEEKLRKAQNLRANYKKSNEEYTKQLDIFKKQVTKEDIDIVKDKLLETKGRINYFYENLSGLKAKINNLIEQEEENRRERIKISKEIKEQNKDWNDFDSILNIGTDQIAEDNLTRVIRQQQELSRELETEESALENFKNDKDSIQNKIKNIKEIDTALAMNRYYFVAIGLIGIGAISSLLLATNWIGIAITLVGILGGGISYLTTYLANTENRNRKRELELSLEDINNQISTKREAIAEIKKELEPLNSKLNNYRRVLGLPLECTPGLIKDTFRSVKGIKEKIINLRTKNEKLAKKKNKLKNELEELYVLIKKFFEDIYEDEIEWKKESLIEESNKLFIHLEQVYNWLEIAKELDVKEMNKKELEDKIKEFLPEEIDHRDLLGDLNQFSNHCEQYNDFKQLKERIEGLKTNLLASLKTDRIRKAFCILEESNREGASTKKELLSNFNSLYERYTSLEDVEREYDRKKDDLDALEDKLEELKNERQSLHDKKENLATSNKLEKAQKQIDRARGNLKPLAEEFAVNKAASFILDKVRARCIGKVKDELLKPASNILKELTGNEYKEILPQDSLTEVDFKLKLNDDKLQNTTEVLSRGTKEQLFLAVRMSRIKEMKPLPVILDDSLVNFDAYHLNQAVDFLIRLAQSHQIFVLTCHSKLVEGIANQADNAQYWRLEEGEFNHINNSEELIDYLSL